MVPRRGYSGVRHARDVLDRRRRARIVPRSASSPSRPLPLPLVAGCDERVRLRPTGDAGPVGGRRRHPRAAHRRARPRAGRCRRPAPPGRSTGPARADPTRRRPSHPGSGGASAEDGVIVSLARQAVGGVGPAALRGSTGSAESRRRPVAVRRPSAATRRGSGSLRAGRQARTPGARRPRAVPARGAPRLRGGPARGARPPRRPARPPR